MPVRIYDLAKKLGLDSKSVLAKAKELGIATAKVPSSSLDKITAEYLEEQLRPMAKHEEPPPAARIVDHVQALPPPPVEISAPVAPPPVTAAPVELPPAAKTNEISPPLEVQASAAIE